MLDKLVGKIKQSEKIYILARCIKNISDPDLCKLLKGYYENYDDCMTIMIDNPHNMYNNKVIYNIELGVENTSEAGLLALLKFTLLGLTISERLGCIARVVWGKYCLYFDEDLKNESENVFEYYFEPLSGNKLTKIELSDRAVINFTKTQLNALTDVCNGYHLSDDDLRCLACAYSKYIKLNQKVKEFLDGNMIKRFNHEKILGVHYRGTDFNIGLKDHPIKPEISEYIKNIEDRFIKGEYDRIFVATEDLNALEVFNSIFKEKICYYNDVVRSNDNIGPHSKKNTESYYKYRIGLEVLRDVYTLADCDGLICGLSQVAYAARYIKISKGKEFSELVVIDKGTHGNDSPGAKMASKNSIIARHR